MRQRTVNSDSELRNSLETNIDWIRKYQSRKLLYTSFNSESFIELHVRSCVPGEHSDTTERQPQEYNVQDCARLYETVKTVQTVVEEVSVVNALVSWHGISGSKETSAAALLPLPDVRTSQSDSIKPHRSPFVSSPALFFLLPTLYDSEIYLQVCPPPIMVCKSFKRAHPPTP